jgi:amidophosphoribosyltransferase
MCGIVGIHLKDPALEPRLGELLVPMIEALTGRGPDSAGLAIYDRTTPDGSLRWSLRGPDADYDWQALAAGSARRSASRPPSRSRSTWAC